MKKNVINRYENPWQGLLSLKIITGSDELEEVDVGAIRGLLLDGDTSSPE